MPWSVSSRIPVKRDLRLRGGRDEGAELVEVLRVVCVPTVVAGEADVAPAQRPDMSEQLVCLPPYSPDFNPIEKGFAKLKALLRNAVERSVEGLWRAIGRLVDLITPAEALNYFQSCR